MFGVPVIGGEGREAILSQEAGGLVLAQGAPSLNGHLVAPSQEEKAVPPGG